MPERAPHPPDPVRAPARARARSRSRRAQSRLASWTLCCLLSVACTGTIDGAPGGNLESAGTGANTGGPAQRPAPGVPGAAPGASTTPAPGAVSPASCSSGLKAATPSRIRRLTATQFNNSIAALRGVASARVPFNPFNDALGDARFSTYTGRASLPAQGVSLLMDAAEAAALDIAASVRKDAPCAAATKLDRGCLEGALGKLALKAFRRPATTTEISDLVALALGEADADSGLRLAIEAMIVSPSFIFRWELGQGPPDSAGRLHLGPYEIASALSYTLSDAPPDAPLLAAAQAGELSTPEHLRPHVVRLLAPQLGAPGAGAVPAGPVQQFFHEAFHYDRAPQVFKDAKMFPSHNPEQLVQDTDAFVRHTLSQRKGFLETLLTAPTGFARAGTAASYGLKVTGTSPTAVTFPDGQRSGILTQPSFLVAESEMERNTPVQRGRLINETLLCRPVPDIPLTDVPPLPEMPGATLRERLRVHSATPPCAGCHALMDPIGLVLEQYDHVGRYRTTEAGKPVDTTGALSGAGSEDGPLTGPVDLAARLGRSQVVRQCFATIALRYWVGRDDSAGDACTLKAADEAYLRSQGDAAELFASLLTSDSFVYRIR